MIEMEAGDYRLVISPDRGGSIFRFDWRGLAIMRPVCGPSILDVACFPLVPFSNRIAHGRFGFDDREVCLAPNFPGGGHPHPLHGFGWLVPWKVVAQDNDAVTLAHAFQPGDWPWAYRAEQTFKLGAQGLTMELTLTNESNESMPAGVGFHPYFPRDRQTRYYGLHRGEWRNDSDCLPTFLDLREDPLDWWAGRPVGERAVDTVYTDRAGSLRIDWPTTGMSATITCSDSLRHTVVYTPADQDFFCVEPVTNETNEFNREGCPHIAPFEQLRGSVRLQAAQIPRRG